MNSNLVIFITNISAGSRVFELENVLNSKEELDTSLHSQEHRNHFFLTQTSAN
jgi:hypothetical protein